MSTVHELWIDGKPYVLEGNLTRQRPCTHTFQLFVAGRGWLCVCQLGTVADHPRASA